MRHVAAAIAVSFAACSTAPALLAGTTQETTSGNAATSGQPFTPQQIAYEFGRLPLETQKLLLKTLMSQSNEQESQDSTSQLNGVYATLPAEVQQDLYAKWNALSDEQRIALKQMNPEMIKPLLIGVFKGEIDQHRPDTASLKKALNEGASFAERSRAYVQKWLHGNGQTPVEDASNDAQSAR